MMLPILEMCAHIWPVCKLNYCHTGQLAWWFNCLTNFNTQIQKLAIFGLQVLKMGYTIVTKMYKQLAEARNAPGETSPTHISVRLSVARQTMFLLRADFKNNLSVPINVWHYIEYTLLHSIPHHLCVSAEALSFAQFYNIWHPEVTSFFTMSKKALNKLNRDSVERGSMLKMPKITCICSAFV